MDDSDQSRGLRVSRRTVLGAVGATAVGSVTASARIATQDTRFTLRQGDRCVPVTPISGSATVEEFYDYRLPERFVSAENGGSAAGSGPTYSSVGTQDLQRHDTSIAFLYDGPEGLSLVVVHGKVGASPNDGGAATFEVAGLPDGGEWVVKDDLYRTRSGELAPTNYDRWELDGATDTIHWTWGSTATDGGAFRGLSDDLAVTVRPAFNDRASLYRQHYEGTVDAWQFLIPDGDGIRRVSLDMTTPISIQAGTCQEDSGDLAGEQGDGAEVVAVEFKGCGAAWIVFEDDEGPWPVSATVETSAGDREVGITANDLTTVPGQFGANPLYKANGEGKVLAVVIGEQRYENDNQCASRADDDGSSAEDEENENDDEDDGNGRGGNGKGNGNGEGNGNGNGNGKGNENGKGNGKGKDKGKG